MGSISHHITPLVINSLGGGHTHVLMHTDIYNFKKPGTRLVYITIQYKTEQDDILISKDQALQML